MKLKKEHENSLFYGVTPPKPLKDLSKAELKKLYEKGGSHLFEEEPKAEEEQKTEEAKEVK